eukprot:2081107-Prymnesium_polylepis.1
MRVYTMLVGLAVVAVAFVPEQPCARGGLLQPVGSIAAPQLKLHLKNGARPLCPIIRRCTAPIAVAPAASALRLLSTTAAKAVAVLVRFRWAVVVVAASLIAAAALEVKRQLDTRRVESARTLLEAEAKATAARAQQALTEADNKAKLAQ